MQIGRKIYYLKNNGNILVNTGERQGAVQETTTDEDFQTYTDLQGVERSAVGVIQCDYGYQADNFMKYPFHIDTTKNQIDETAIVWDTNNPIGATLTDVKASKIVQMQDFYSKTIYDTFQSTAFDGTTEETYSSSATDQVRINGEVTMAMAVKAGFSTETISWKNVNQTQCVTWTADAMIKLGVDLHKFVTAQTDYLEQLTVYINSLTAIADVNNVTWGMTIPSTTISSTSATTGATTTTA